MSPSIAMSLAALLAALAATPAVAQEVGSAAAVNPLSESTPPGRETRALQIGARIVHNEKIQTTASGTAQLLFIDKTTLNIGPNSNLVIDSFVFDPAAGAGEMVTSLTKGALRFVGGQLSHQGAATVNTPVATIGIRGGTATISHGKDGTRAINHFGQLSITNACGTVVIRRTGFAVTVPDRNSCISEPQRASQAEIDQYLALLTSKPGQTGGATSIPTDVLVGQFGIGQLYGFYGPDSPPVQQQTTNVETNVFDIIVQAIQKGGAQVQSAPQQRPNTGG
ncbi:FecR domain-containing protein [Methylocapsa polymorpha]|uniref:FecR domain-containing protein n=1 Tax=Methylocapsa polymorpha TaxID=3080828 RepID=A0ABZ0HT52_9HYPH|nr:FecR domain-containing protein [Methylocapsa sp. RX1]